MLSIDKKNQPFASQIFSNIQEKRCDCCNKRATKTHFVSEASGILDVCENCDFVLSLQDEIKILKQKS
ncbi:hypothetical protein ES708_21502 [subsurface metagenome]